MSKKKNPDPLEKFWDDLHYTKVRCPHCGNRLPSQNHDRVTPGHCLNLCTMSHGSAMKFQSMLADCAREVKRREQNQKDLQNLLEEENREAGESHE